MIRRKLYFYMLILVLLIIPFKVGLSNSYMGNISKSFKKNSKLLSKLF